VRMYKQAIEEVGTLDTDEVLKLFDDPDWTFEWFGTPGRTFGGLEAYGVLRALEDEVCFSEVVNGVSTLRSCEPIEVP